jgi:DNA-damage-inducible protein J
MRLQILAITFKSGYNKAKRSVIFMANTSAVYARIDTQLKKNAEEILSQLGITPSSAIQMLYSQIVLSRGLPFEARLPARKPVAIGGMTREQLDAELQKGLDSMKNERLYSPDEIDAMFAEEFGI